MVPAQDRQQPEKHSADQLQQVSLSDVMSCVQFFFENIVVSEESARGGMSYIGCSGYDHINIASPPSPETAPQCQILLMLVRDALTATTGVPPALDYPMIMTANAG